MNAVLSILIHLFKGDKSLVKNLLQDAKRTKEQVDSWTKKFNAKYVICNPSM